MEHLDEGTIHAWLDGALPPDESAAVERHVAECAACGAMAAEARGLTAAASRILSALDDVPRSVLPPAITPRSALMQRASRRWWSARGMQAAAALVLMAGGVAVVQSRRDGERGTIMAAMRDTAPLPTAAGSVSPARESVGESRTAASPPLPPRRPARARATSPAPSEPPQPPMREPAARGEALAMADSTAPRPMRSRYAGAAAGASNVAPTVGATVAANVATRQAMVPTRQADAEYRAEAALGSIGAAPAAPKAVLGRAGVADTIVGSVPTASAQSPAFAASARRSPARSIVAMDVASRVGATGCYTLSATRAAPDEGAPTPTRLELTAVDESAGSRLARGSTPPARAVEGRWTTTVGDSLLVTWRGDSAASPPRLRLQFTGAGLLGRAERGDAGGTVVVSTVRGTRVSCGAP